MSESRTPLEDTGHNIIIYGRVFETADVLTDFHEGQPYTMIVRITSTTRKVIEPDATGAALRCPAEGVASRCRFRRS